MAVRSQEMHNTARAGSPPSRTRIMLPTISLHSVAYIVTALLALLAIYAIMGNVMGWGRARYDDLRYSTTRTFQADEVVGHDDGAGTPTHFIAMNLNRQVLIIEIPGGDAVVILSHALWMRRFDGDSLGPKPPGERAVPFGDEACESVAALRIGGTDVRHDRPVGVGAEERALIRRRQEPAGVVGDAA